MQAPLLNLILAASLMLAGTLPASGQTPPPAASKSEAELILVLKSDATQQEKADACLFLARVGTRAAVPALVALLADDNLSHMARYALETIADPAVDVALRKSLETLQGRRLVGVVGSLGVRRDAKAVRPLSRFLADADPELAQAAARALGNIGTSAAVKALQAGLAKAPSGNQLAFCEALFRCAESRAADAQAKEARAIYVWLRSQPALPHQVRAGVLIGVIRHDPKQRAALIREALNSSDYVLTAAAVRAAQSIRDADVTRALTADLDRLPEDKQLLVIQALGERRDAEALPALFARVQSGSRPVRVAALRALPMLGQPTAVPVLVARLQDGDRDVALAAQEGLATLPGREADAAIMALLASADADLRLLGLELVGRRRMMGSIPTLLKLAADADARVRPGAIRRLGELGGPSVLAPLLEFLQQAKESADLNAAEQALGAVALRGAQLDAAIGQLISALTTARPAPKSALLGVLTSLGGPTALKAVRAAVDDTNADVHVAALRGLAAWKTREAAPELLALARSAGNATDRMICLRGYLGWASNSELAAEERLSMCREAAGLVQLPEEKKLLLGALGSLPAVGAVEMAAGHLGDATTKEEATAAIVAAAEALLKGDQAAQAAPKLIGPLDQAAQATANPDLAQRAKAQLLQARAKAGGN